MKFQRHFTKGDKPIADQIQWKTTPAFISGAVDMPEVETPIHWSQNAVNILAKNYLRKAGVPSETYNHFSLNNPNVENSTPIWLRESKPTVEAIFSGETSAKQVFHRMAGHWTYVGWKHGYFSHDGDIKYNEKTAEINARYFYDEIYWMLANQMAAPNSPQWFNTGLWWAYGIQGPASGQWAIDYSTGEPFETPNAYEYPQPHACFIQPVSDDLVNSGGIMDLWTREVRLFKQGSGTGSNFSTLRGKNESLSGGGVSSGMMSFLKIGDVAAGAIASGGTTRRAAKMVVVDADHPEIEEFVDWKVREQRKALAMHVGSKLLAEDDGGEIYGIDFEGEAINSVSGQNSNNSVRITDQFLEMVNKDEIWNLISRTKKDNRTQVVKTVRAKSLWSKICHAAHVCADPGVQFHDTINAWHTCSQDGPIRASNPCSEYMFLDNTACNLASLNLCRFLGPDGQIDLDGFEYAVRLWTVVLDISVSMASFPSREIAIGSYNYRTLGLGYANAGGLLMRLGLAYDSDEGRNLIASLTALMHGVAYLTSAQLVSVSGLGPFPRWEANRDSMTKILQKHKDAVLDLNCQGLATLVVGRAFEVWKSLGGGCAFRNAQVTLLAPTGTISFVMDCDTTGIEPEFALIKHKALSGGGSMDLVNETVGSTLLKLGYKVPQCNLILAHIKQHGIVEDCPYILPEHLSVFDCATPPRGRALRPMAHVLMVAAVQPFLSGAVSKTINMPNDSTIEDVNQVYREAHRLGLKAVAIYRDGSKLNQPLTTKKKDSLTIFDEAASVPKEVWNTVFLNEPKVEFGLDRGKRERLPDRCSGYRQKFRVDNHPVYLHTGEYENKTLGEIFIEVSDEGSSLRAWANAVAKAISLGIQHGVPLEEFVEAFSNQRFEPSGIVEGHSSIKMASSILSAVFRDLGIHYLGRTDLGNVQPDAAYKEPESQDIPPITIKWKKFPETDKTTISSRASGQFCGTCGTLMRQTGPCYTCPGCGNTTGCG